MDTLQSLRLQFIQYQVHPTEWLGDSPSRFDAYTAYAKGCDSILELGVYSGLTTTAFLLANPKKIVSIDITDEYFKNKYLLEQLASSLNIQYEFYVTNDLEFTSNGHDLLFIDTSHTYEQTLAELNKFGQLTQKRIVLHDVSSFFGVYRAVFEWLWENKNFHVVEHDTRGDGVVVLDRLFGS